VPPFEEPVSRSDQALLRHLVLDHKAAERRRRFPAVLHVGSPGGAPVGQVDESEDVLDDALRCELLGAMLRSRPPGRTMVWLTRPGELDVQDVDLAWLRAVAAVGGEAEDRLPYVVVTRRGWLDPRTGSGRSWTRLRQR
jgi:hypothetical protein